MINKLANPKQFKAELKDKWLDYYQTNRDWLQNYMDEDSGWCDSVEYDEEQLENLGFDENYEPRRPECYFILGVISVLEPSITGLLAFTGNFTNDSEEIIKALGLDFDPELELKKRPRKQINTDLENLDRIREEKT